MQTDTATAAPAAEADPTPEGATEPIGGDSTSQGEPTVEPTIDLTPLDLEQYGSYGVPIKVNGEDQLVPLSEAVSGHMMHADYTRKTQELAEQRQAVAEAIAIQEALAADPVTTLQVLSEFYGPESDPQELEELDPQERAIQEIQQRFEQMDRQAEEAALQAELNRLSQTHGVDPNQLLAFAVQNQIPNLEWAHAVMAQTTAQAAQQDAARIQAAESARVDAKRNASVIEGGADRSSGASTAPVGDRTTVGSVSDAFALAKQQLGL